MRFVEDVKILTNRICRNCGKWMFSYSYGRGYLKAKKKLIMTGNAYTYMITLPKEWVKKLKWRAKQMLELELKEKDILIRDYKNK